MKQHLIACHRNALREGLTGLADSLAELYFREYRKPIPTPEVEAVSVYLNSKPPFRATTTHEN